MSQEEPLLPDDEDDKRLMGLVAGGDDDALRLLVHRHHARLVGYLRGEVGSQATAEELAMEVFIRLHRAAARWRPEAKLTTYLIHIARNLVLNEWRRRGRKPGRVVLESRFPAETTDALTARGHDLQLGDDWSEGRLTAAAKGGTMLKAAANPRGMQGYAVGR